MREVKLSRKGRETREPTGIRNVRGDEDESPIDLHHLDASFDDRSVNEVVDTASHVLSPLEIHMYLQEWLCLKLNRKALVSKASPSSSSVDSMRATTSSLLIQWATNSDATTNA